MSKKKKKSKYLTVPSVSLMNQINNMSLLDDNVKTGLINLYKREETLVENILKQLTDFVFVLNSGKSIIRIDIYDYPTEEDEKFWIDGEYRVVYTNDNGTPVSMIITTH